MNLKIDYNQIVNMCLWAEVALAYTAITLAAVDYRSRLLSERENNKGKIERFNESLDNVLHLDILRR